MGIFDDIGDVLFPPFSVEPDPDSDADGLADQIDLDEDGDGLDDRREALHGGDPLRVDTDGDLLTDADEVDVHGTDPGAADSDGVLDVTAAPGEGGPAFETSALPQPSPAAFVAQVQAEDDLTFGVDGAAKGHQGGSYHWPADPVGDPPDELPTTVEGRAADAGHAIPFGAGTTIAPGGTDGATGDPPAEPVETEGTVAPPEPFEPDPDFGVPVDDATAWVDVLPEPEPEPVGTDGGFDGMPDGVPDAVVDSGTVDPVPSDDGPDEALVVDG